MLLNIDSGINETPADLEIDNSTVNENVQQSRQIYVSCCFI